MCRLLRQHTITAIFGRVAYRGSHLFHHDKVRAAAAAYGKERDCHLYQFDGFFRPLLVANGCQCEQLCMARLTTTSTALRRVLLHMAALSAVF